MALGKKLKIRVLLAPLAVFALFAFACRSDTSLEGVYIVREHAEERPFQLSIELKENGVGFWRADGDEVPLRWEVKGLEIRLSTKAGGIIIGSIEGSVIHIRLPGKEPLKFTKSN